MFSVIATIYNKKTKRTYLNGIVHSHRISEKFVFLTARDVRCVNRG
jgi:aspartyl/asparaginyl-tRNA synthetase